jgi:hypothetical protein
MYSVPPAKCGYHASRPAVAHCAICGRAVCRSCAQPDKKAKPICRPCALQTGVPQRRSRGITVLAVLNIVSGGLGILCLPIAALWPGGREAAHEAAAIAAIPGYAAYSMAGVAFSFAVAIACFVTGIGLLRLRDWARKGTIIIQITGLAWGAAGQMSNLLWIVPAKRAAGIAIRPMETDIISNAAMWAFAVAMSMLYIIFFTRPMVKVQFGRQLKNWTPPSAVVPPGQRANSGDNRASEIPFDWLALDSTGKWGIPILAVFGIIIGIGFCLFMVVCGLPSALGVVLGVLLVAGGIGLFRRRNWARMATIVSSLFISVMMFLEAASPVSFDSPYYIAFHRNFGVLILVFAGIGVISFVYTLTAAVYLTRRRVRACFR